MLNKEFQDLRAQWGKNSAERANIIAKNYDTLWELSKETADAF